MRNYWDALSALPAVAHEPGSRAAVLVPLYDDHNGQTRVVLTRRPDTMRTHPGDVVFPGGQMEDGEDPVATALREAHEEIGLEPEAVAEILGALTSVTTRNIDEPIIPVVARVVRPKRFILDPSEVEAVIEPRLEDLLDDGSWRTSDWYGRTMWFYEFDEGTLWGATASMVRELVSIVR